MIEYDKPMDIERRSFEIITQLLGERTIPAENELVVKRVIHTTADFDYAENLAFSAHAVAQGIAALRAGCDIVTDTQMARSGINKRVLEGLGGQVHCFMSEAAVAALAERRGSTRAAASMRWAAEHVKKPCIFAVGNAPTALLELGELIRGGALSPALVIGVPVGFVNVVESKERLFAVCEKHGVPAIVAMGRKGGSNVAAAICNALIYSAAEMLDPSARGWK